ncbi:MAG: T9SS type A sorting domain-containing protein [Candidatus Cloacimonadales bacterium]|nr:T9SS type A sorting domain-containing protein [Candidatus Cloacimonadales bacterium]
MTLDDWTEDEIICSDPENEICSRLDLSDIYAAYDEATNSISFALPVQYEIPDSEQIKCIYALVFDDEPGGFYNNFLEPAKFSNNILVGFENARINKVISLIIEHYEGYPENTYLLNYSYLSSGSSGSVFWQNCSLSPQYLSTVYCITDNVLEFSFPADSLNLENCKMAVISSEYNDYKPFGIADDTIPTSLFSPSEPLYGNEFAYFIRDYIDLGAEINYSQSKNVAKPVLYSNFPNPFNAGTKIKFKISQEAKVEINIYNIKGQKIRDLEKKNFKVGLHFVDWDGKDNLNKKLASGIYLIELLIDGKNQTVQKCMHLK